MAIGQEYMPQWLRLREAIQHLCDLAGFDEDRAKSWLIRAIQDRLNPNNPGPMFRLPAWRYSPRFPWRSVSTSEIDWENSTIVAPHALGRRRLAYYEPTLIEISAAEFERCLANHRPEPAAASKISAPMIADFVRNYFNSTSHPTMDDCVNKWPHGSSARDLLREAYRNEAKSRGITMRRGPRQNSAK
jgi:hypothetical protein